MRAAQQFQLLLSRSEPFQFQSEVLHLRAILLAALQLQLEVLFIIEAETSQHLHHPIQFADLWRHRFGVLSNAAA